MSRKSVKLSIYQFESDKTYIDSIEAESFSDFVLIRLVSGLEDHDVERIHDTFKNIFEDKKIIVIPEDLNIAFYGIEKEEEDGSGSPCCELQHERDAEEIT